jgi:hypothetical protein
MFSKSVKPNKASSESKSSEEVQRNNVGAVRNTGLVATIKAATHGIDSLLIPSKNSSDEAKADVPVSQGVTFSEHDTETKGDGSVNRTIIDDDDDSDIDDVPEATPPVAVAVARLCRLKAIVQSSNLAAFFESMQYRSASLIFGPMQCFFYIAYVVKMLFHMSCLEFFSRDICLTIIRRSQFAPQTCTLESKNFMFMESFISNAYSSQCFFQLYGDQAS